MPGLTPAGLIVPLEQMHHEVFEMAPQRVPLTDAQALHLLCQGLPVDVGPRPCPDQGRCGLRPGVEILVIESPIAFPG